MKFTLDQFRACAAGCFEIREEPEGLFFDRMTPALRALYGTAEGALIRARCQTGIRLRFESDTDSLRLSLRLGRAARAINVVDLIVDGVFQASFTGTLAVQPWTVELFANPDRRPRRFELWLPYAVESWVVSLEIGDNATLKPLPPEPVTWLVIGDSITQGMTCSSPARTYAGLAARAAGFNHHNTGVGGAIMDPAAGGAAAIPATFATVAFGCNDWNRCLPLAEFESATLGLFDALLALHPGLPVGLITPLPAVWATGEKNKSDVWLESYRDVLRKIAPRFPAARLIEGPQLVPADPGCFVDGIHPNTTGMAVVARNLAMHLQILAAAG